MQALNAIYKRELGMYFKSPIAYVLFAIFSLVSGLVFALYLFQGYALLTNELNFLQSLFFILIPLLTMKSFSEEKKNRTDLLLLTSPAKLSEIVMGKYLAAVTLFVGMSALTLIHLGLTMLMQGRIDLPVLGSYLAYFLTAFAYIAIGLFCSALSENQIISGIVSMVIFLIFAIFSSISSVIGQLISTAVTKLDSLLSLFSSETKEAIAPAVTSALNWLNPSTRLPDFSRGIFSLTPIFFLLSYAGIFLYFTMKLIEKRRWVQR